MIDALLPLVFTRQQAVRLGFTQHAIDWRLARGNWHALRRGVFCLAATYESANAEQRHLLASLGVLLAAKTAETVSHLSAALSYGWPGPPEIDPDPWTTVPSGLSLSTRRRHGRVRQVAPLPPTDVDHPAQLPLTSPTRTVADCLRHFPAETSVPIADAAIRAGADQRAVGSMLGWQDGWPYAARGHASAALVDGRRESWLESRSAVAFHRAGLSQPTPQVDILDDRGRPVARVDFLWAEFGVVGEADGWAKYSMPGATTQPLEALRAEKRREDRLRELGYELVRWTAGDVIRFTRLRESLYRAMARARPDRLRGSRRLTVARAPHAVPALGLRSLADLTPTRQLLLPGSYSLAHGDLAS